MTKRMYRWKRLLGGVLAVVMLLSMLPAAALAAGEEPTAAWRMEVENDASRTDGKPVYKLVGSVTSPTGLRTLETWIAYDNTMVVPVTYEWEDLSVGQGATTRDPFTVLIQNGRTPMGTLANGWYVKGDRTIWYYTLGEPTNPITKAVEAADYLEFYFRVADGKSVDDFNVDTFQIKNQDEVPEYAKACTIMGTDNIEHKYYNAGSGMTNEWEVTLTYHNSGKPADRYVAQVGGEGYASVQAAVAAIAASAEKTGTVTLLDDSRETAAARPTGENGETAEAGVCVPAGCTVVLELDGHRLTVEGGSAVAAYGALTIQDTSAAQTGRVEAGASAQAVTCSGSGAVTITGGTFTSETGTAVQIGSAGRSVVTGGGFTGLTALSAGDCEGMEVVIEGGDFHSGKDSDAVTKHGTKGSLTISGGRFKRDESTQPLGGLSLLAPGKVLSAQPDGEGYYTIVRDPKLDTVTFLANGRTAASMAPGELEAIEDPTRRGYTFLGWFKDVTVNDKLVQEANGDYLLTPGVRQAGFTGTECRPKYDTAGGGDVYHAVWMPEGIQTGALVTDGTSVTYYPRDDAAPYLKTATVAALAFNKEGTRLKLLSDEVYQTSGYEDPIYSALNDNGGVFHLTAPMVLDMNGHTVSWNDDTTRPLIAIDTSGRTDVENSSLYDARLSNTNDYPLKYSQGRGTVRDLIVNTPANSSYEGIYVGGSSVLHSLERCEILSEGAGGIYVYSGGSIEKVADCIITGNKGPFYNRGQIHIESGAFAAVDKDAFVFDQATGGLFTFPAGMTLSDTADGEGYRGLTAGFTITYSNGGTVLEQDLCPTGTAPRYDGQTPTKVYDGTYSYTFKGWSTAEDGSALVEDVSALKADITLYAAFDAVEMPKVAQVGEETFTTVQAAVDAIQATDSKTGTITMLADSTEAANVMVDQKTANIVLDLAGHRLEVTANYGVYLKNGATVTLRSSTPGGSLKSKTNVTYVNNGNLTVEDGVTISGGTRGIQVTSTSSTLNVQGGSISGSAYGIYFSSLKSAVISGGSIEGASDVAVSVSSTNAAKITLTGGRFKTGGREDLFKNPIALPAGKVFSPTPDADGYYALVAESSLPPVAETGGTQYVTLKSAVAAVQGTGTVTLLGDVTLPFGADAVTVAAGQTVTLDLRGHSITAAYIGSTNSGVIYNNGTLHLTSTGGTPGTLRTTASIESILQGKPGNYISLISNNPGSTFSAEDLVLENAKYGISNGAGTVEYIRNCTIRDCVYGLYGSQKSYNGSYPLPKYGTIENCTIDAKEFGISLGRGLDYVADRTTVDLIKNCQITAELYSAIYNGGQIGAIEGGIYTGGECGLVQAACAYPDLKSSTVIRDGTFTGTKFAGVEVNSGTVTISGGTISSAVNNAVGVYEDGAAVVEGGRYRVSDPELALLYGNVTLAKGKALAPEADAEGYYPILNKVAQTPDMTVTGGTAAGTVDGAVTVEQGAPVTVTAKAAADGETVTKSQVTFPQTVVDQLDRAHSAQIETDVGGVTFDAPALDALKTAAAGKDLVLTLEKKTADTVLEAQKDAVQSAKALVDLTLTAGGEAVGFSGGTVKVRIPYAGEDYGGLNVFYIDDQGRKAWIASAYDTAAKAFEFTAAHFSLYAVDETVTFTAKVTGPDGTLPGGPGGVTVDRDPGDTVTVEIWGTPSQDTVLGSFQLKLDYDHDRLALSALTSPLSGDKKANPEADTLAFTVSGEGVAMTTAGLKLADAVFTVRRGIAAGPASIGLVLADSEITRQGKDASPLIGAAALPVRLHNSAITLLPGEHAGFPADAEQSVAYTRYQSAGLFTDDSYQSAYVLPELTPAPGWRMAKDTEAEPLWQGASTPSGAPELTTQQLRDTVWTADQTFTARTVKTQTITLAATIGGTLGSTAAITVDAGTLLKDAGLPTAEPHEGYHFAGWQAGGQMLDLDTFTVDSDVALTAVFSAKTFGFASTADNAAFSGLTGVTGGKAAYGTDVTFRVTPQAGYAVTQVSYSVAGGAAVTLSAQEGVYTIPGTAILGDVAVEAATQRYFTVTFQAGIGAEMTTTAAYVKAGADTTLYADLTFDQAKKFVLPAPEAAPGYRLARDGGDEPLWKNGTDGYTAAALSAGTYSPAFNGDTTLTAQAVKTWAVTYTAGPNGALAAGSKTSETVDDGTLAASLTMPGTTPEAGYVLDRWTQAPVGDAIMADTAFTASFKDGVYAVTFPTVTGVSFTDQTGLTGGQAVHGTPVTFRMTVAEGYAVTAVGYQVGAAEAVPLAADGDGTYTIPGSAIVGDISITIESKETVKVTFTAGEHGQLTGGDKTITVDKGHTLLASEVPEAVGSGGYTFLEWRVGGQAAVPAGHQAVADVTFTAVFADASYSVSFPQGVTGGGATASHGADYVFTPVKEDWVVIKAGYTVDGGPIQSLSAQADGSYAIPGDAITGPIAITVEAFQGRLSFVDKESYKGLAAGTKVLLVETDKLDGQRYQFTDGAALYWSGSYGAYAAIVAEGETPASAASKLAVTSGMAEEVSHGGDMNGSGTITAADAGIINDILHEKRIDATSDLMRLMADVTGDRTVTTTDVAWVLERAVGLAP